MKKIVAIAAIVICLSLPVIGNAAGEENVNIIRGITSNQNYTIPTDGNLTNILELVGVAEEVVISWTFPEPVKFNHFYIHVDAPVDGVMRFRTKNAAGGTLAQYSIFGENIFYENGVYKYEGYPEQNVKSVEIALSGTLRLREVELWYQMLKATTPTGFAGSYNNSNVSFIWDAHTDEEVIGYNLYSDGSKINSSLITGTSYTYPITSPTERYIDFELSAVKMYDLESDRATIAVKVDNIPPATPKDLAAVAGNNKITLNWTANTEADLHEYNIYRDGVKIASLPKEAQTYTDNGRTNGVTYNYAISAVDLTGNESPRSQQISVVPDLYPPSTPNGLRANPLNEQLQLIWDQNIDPDLVGYNLYRDGVIINSEPITGTSYLDTGLTNFQSYSYRVSAVNIYGLESPLSAVVVGMPEDPDVTPPAIPINLFADPGDKTVQLNWQPNSESDLAGYYLYRNGVRINKEPLTLNSYTDTGLKNGVTYTYTITAIDNSNNESDHSAPVTATPILPAQAAPEDLRADAGDKQVSLTWSAKAGATEYRIYRDGNLIATTTDPYYLDTDVVNQKKYGYQVSGIVNGVESDLSPVVTATPGNVLHFSGVSLPGVAGVVLSAFSFAGMFAPILILILALTLAAVIISFIIWLVRRAKHPKTQEQKAEQARRTLLEQQDRDNRRAERKQWRERMSTYDRLTREGRISERDTWAKGIEGLQERIAAREMRQSRNKATNVTPITAGRAQREQRAGRDMRDGR